MEKATIRFIVFSKGLPIGGANVKLCIEIEKFKIEIASALTDRVGYGKIDIPRDMFDNRIKTARSFTDANVFDLIMEAEGCVDETKKLLSGNADELFEFITTASKTLFKLFVSRMPELGQNGKISAPDLIDYQLSPNSFLIKSDVKIGDASGCEHIVPSTLPLREYSFFRVCVVENVLATKSENAGLPSVRDKVTHETEIKWGYISEFKQTWFSLGHSLGEIKYSLALAPGEAVKIAVVDWKRKDEADRTAGNQSKEFLSHDQTVTRDIDDIVSGKINEKQSGYSFTAGAGVPLGPVSVSASAGFTHTEGVRDFVSNSHQTIHNKVVQDSNLVRSQNSSVVIQATQNESSYLSTRIVANMNRGHALSVLYYEILRHFGVLTEFVKLQPCVLIPVSLVEFDIETAKRYRSILQPALLDDSLSKAFDAPQQPTQVSSGTTIQPNLNVTDNSAMVAIGFEITFTTEWQWDGKTYVPPADTGGAIELDLKMVDGAVIPLVRAPGIIGVQRQFQHKKNFEASFPGWKTTLEEFENGEAGRTISTYTTIAPNVDISKIIDIGLRWEPYKLDIPFFEFKDRWNLSRLRIVAKTNKSDFTILNHSHSSTAQLFPSDPTGNKEEKHFSPAKPSSSSAPGVAAPFVPPPPPPPPGSTSSREAVSLSLLIEHLNNNSFYYSEKIWMLMDPKERRLRLNKFAGGILSKTSDQPLGMSGNHLAFPYFGNVPDYVAKAANFEGRVPNTESIVALPTRGIFAEAHLGHCNAAEERDITRYWAFDELPVSLLPNIDNLSASSRFQQPNLTADNFLDSSLTVQPQPNLPNPGEAIAKALELLGKPDIFKDMSAKKEVADVLAKLIESTKPQTIVAERKSSSSASEAIQVRPSTTPPSQPKPEGSEEGKTMLDVDKFKGSLINPKDFFDGTKAMESWLTKADITKEEKSEIRKSVVKPVSTLTRDRLVLVKLLSDLGNIPVHGELGVYLTDNFLKDEKSIAHPFTISDGQPFAKVITRFHSGLWSGIFDVSYSPKNDIISIPVTIPGFPDFEFQASKTDFGTKEYQTTCEVQVKESDDSMVLEIRPILDTKDIVREIELSANATTSAELRKELKTAVEASGNYGLAQLKGSVESAIGAAFRVEGSIGASQKVNVIMTYHTIKSLKVERTQ